MSRRALLGLAFLLACDLDPATSVAPPREIGMALHDPGANQTATRSQPAGTHRWTGRSDDIVYVQMTAPAQAVAQITTAVDGAGDSPDEVVVFLDGAGQLGDLGRRVDSSGEFAEAVLPSTFDVVVAPDALLGRHPMTLFSPVTFAGDAGGEALEWIQPERHPTAGRVVLRDGQPVAGAVLTVYRPEEPRLPLGVTVTSDSEGYFGFDLPEGRYDLIVTGPGDGSAPIPTVRLQNQQLPLLPGVQLRVELPVVPVVPVRGQVRLASGDAAVGRLRLEGVLTDLVPGGSGIPMGRTRLEFETESDGSWEADLPLGRWTATAFPRYSGLSIGQGLATGRASFEVPVGAESVEDVHVVLQDSGIVRIEAFNPGGSPMVGARLVLRMTTAPRYVYGQITGAEGALRGAWIGNLMPGIYDIELIPPPDDAGDTRLSRVQARVDITAQPVVTLQAERSDAFEGLVFTTGEEAVGDVRVELRDPDTGALLDEATTRNAGDFRGLFRGVVPR